MYIYRVRIVELFDERSITFCWNICKIYAKVGRKSFEYLCYDCNLLFYVAYLFSLFETRLMCQLL